MTVIVLGAGSVGSAAADALASRGNADVAIADLSLERARRVADRFGWQGHSVDVTDDAQLDGLLADASAVINTTGPFYRFGTCVLASALRTGTTYVDVADDPAPTLAMLDLNEQARDFGITAVVGAGASPGLSNLLAMLAAQRLDTVDDVVTAWPEDPVADLSTLGATASAATIHWIHQLSRPVPALRAGGIVDIQPLAPMALHVPDVGEVPAWTVGHPEAVTLHRALPGLRSSTNVMMLRPYDAALLAVLLNEVAAGMDEETAATQVRQRYASVDIDRREHDLACPHLLAQAVGRSDGKAACVTAMLTAYPDGGMGPITAIPAVLALEQLFDRPLPGVHPPEVALDPERLFGDLLAFVPSAEKLDDLVVITKVLASDSNRDRIIS